MFAQAAYGPESACERLIASCRNVRGLPRATPYAGRGSLSRLLVSRKVGRRPRSLSPPTVQGRRPPSVLQRIALCRSKSESPSTRLAGWITQLVGQPRSFRGKPHRASTLHNGSQPPGGRRLRANSLRSLSVTEDRTPAYSTGVRAFYPGTSLLNRAHPRKGRPMEATVPTKMARSPDAE